MSQTRLTFAKDAVRISKADLDVYGVHDHFFLLLFYLSVWVAREVVNLLFLFVDYLIVSHELKLPVMRRIMVILMV